MKAIRAVTLAATLLGAAFSPNICLTLSLAQSSDSSDQSQSKPSIIVVFGLHLTGLLPIRALYADKRLHGLSNGGTAARSFLMGFAFALGWAPCAGPMLAAVLTFAASEATIYRGVALLAIYSLGLALPFVLSPLCSMRSL